MTERNRRESTPPPAIRVLGDVDMTEFVDNRFVQRALAGD
jgi:hypothetical protein